MQRKDYASMTEKELLTEIAKSGSQRKIFSLVTAIAVLLVFVVLAIGVKKITGVLPAVESALNQVGSAAGELETTMKDVDKIAEQAETSLSGIDSLVENTNKMVQDNTKNVSEAFSNFNKVDFDSLNQAIKDLQDVVQPLAEFANMFRR